MLNQKKILFLIILTCFLHLLFGYSTKIFSQQSAVMQRGNAGRTGFVDVNSLTKPSSVLWQTPQLYKSKTISSGVVISSYNNFISSVLNNEIKYPNPGVVILIKEPARFPTTSTNYISSEIENAMRRPPFSVESAPLYFKDTIYIKINAGDGFLIALDAKKGNVKWYYKQIGTQFSAPVIKNDTLYALTTNKTIHALDIETGNVKWVFSQEEMLTCHLFSPIESDGTLFFVGDKINTIGGLRTYAGEGKIYAFDIQTQKINWVINGKGILTSPAIGNNTAFFGDRSNYLYAVDIKTGKEKWKFKAHAGSPVFANGVVYFDDKEKLYALDAETGQLKWNAKAKGSISTYLAVDENQLYYGGFKGHLYAVDAKDGNLKWVFKTKSECTEPIVTNNAIYVGGDGQFFIINKHTGEKIDEIKVGNSRVSSPALAEGVLFSINFDGIVFSVK